MYSCGSDIHTKKICKIFTTPVVVLGKLAKIKNFE